MEKQPISVKIYNETYALTTDAPAKKVLEIAALVDRKMTSLAEQKKNAAPEKLAVWAALDLAAELVELRERYEKLLAAATER